VVLLRPEGGALTRVSSLDGLGAGQQLKAVRWLDGLAVVVTYQQVDPFYALDLSDPGHPRVLGVLHLPGWSSYLHPVGADLVLGLGQAVPSVGFQPDVRDFPVPEKAEASDTPLPVDPQSADSAPGSTGTATPLPVDPRLLPPRLAAPHAKATVFDLRDLRHPRATASVDYPAESTALAGMEPHQVTWLPDRQLLLTVIGDGYGGRGWLSILTVGAHSLDNRMVRLAPTTDLSTVRTLPVDDGRVVLVNGDEVRFVDV
jgi:Beta propeller domain